MSSIALMPPRVIATGKLTIPAGILGAAVSLMAGVIMLRPALDPDLGWHLRSGQIILATHAIPKTDPFSYTMRGAPWVEQEWLWQAVMALLHQAAGTVGMIVSTALLVAASIGLVYGRLRVRGLAPLYAALGAAGAMVELGFFAGVRPASVIAICVAFYLFAFERYERGQDWRWLVAVVPLQAVWANAHGSYVLGPLLCGVYAVGALWQSANWRRAVPWTSLAVGLAVVSLANPLGLGLLRFTLFASRLPFNRQYTEEWRALDFGSLSSVPILVSIVVLVLLAAICRHWGQDKRQVLMLAVSTLAALWSAQFLLLYAVAAVPLLGEMAFELRGRPAATRVSPLSAAAIAVALAGFCLLPLRFLSTAGYERWMRADYPVDAVSFIQQHQLAGPMWNEFDWGGYLIGALPRLPVFVDGRTEMYGQAFMNQYIHAALGTLPPEPLLDRYGVNFVLVRADTSPLANELRQQPEWREAYDDKLAAIFVRAGSHDDRAAGS